MESNVKLRRPTWKISGHRKEEVSLMNMILEAALLSFQIALTATATGGSAKCVLGPVLI